MSSLPLLVLLGVIGPWQVVIIVALILVLFGGKKIPELMRGMGRGIEEFKDAVNKDYTAETPAKSDRDDQTDRRDDQIVPLARFPSGVPSGMGRVRLIARIYDR